MWCLVSLANSVVLEVQVESKAIGQQCLEKVCKCLDINNEIDYFGLKYQKCANDKKHLWLNLRNPIEHQVNIGSGLGSINCPVRLEFRVKFWVPPHLLLEESTRHQFYLNARLDLVESRLILPNWQTVIKLIALIAQAENGDSISIHSNHCSYANFVDSISIRDNSDQKPNDFVDSIIHKQYEFKGMKQSTAKYWLLREISSISGFGEEMFSTKLLNVPIHLGVGPDGVSVYQHNEFKQSIPFNVIQSASSHRRTFRLEYLNSNYDQRLENRLLVLELKLESGQLASGLYRSITEKHAFYSCETVRSAVTTQFIRDLKGTIVSIFNEDTTLGKKFVFDIRKTCREVYDNARRILFQNTKCANVINKDPDFISNSNNDNDTNTDSKSSKCNDIEEKLTRLLDAMTCKICMDQTINSVFLPCAHVISCSGCARRCDRCPVCRSDIQQSQHIYLPGEVVVSKDFKNT